MRLGLGVAQVGTRDEAVVDVVLEFALQLRRGHRVGLLRLGEAIERVFLAEVPPIEDGAHPWLLGLVIVRVDYHLVGVRVRVGAWVWVGVRVGVRVWVRVWVRVRVRVRVRSAPPPARAPSARAAVTRGDN